MTWHIAAKVLNKGIITSNGENELVTVKGNLFHYFQMKVM